MPGGNRPIREFMSACVRTITLETSLPDARKIMRQEQIRHLPVLDGQRLVGLLSDRDLGRLEGFPLVDFNVVSVPDAMATSPYTVSPEVPVVDVVREMLESRYGSVVVVDGGNVVGLFTTTDAMAGWLAQLESPATQTTG